jgi:lysozyme
MSRRTHLLLIRLGVVALALGVVVAVIVLLGRKGEPRPSAPLVTLPGVDVSSHDRRVSWSKAAQKGLRFVIARATEGDSRVDTAYTSIRKSARAAGLAFTAFHYARPDKAKGDARREAQHFQQVAGIGPGDLVPVLDLEESGGLGVTRLQAWVTTWLEEVGATVGAKPMIYTNSDFWRSHMGDTAAFADAGYPLFIASWGSTTPVMPAAGWGGRGWTLWQTAKCGRVPGIKGCIRTDLFAGADLRAVTITG